ncbi:hypothetical protein HAX54_043722 [Datura stramonium]|uniref:Uncharacterized protein n=1 Tax=Datura stramonium TaxID=4076 RepID=A0ABS8W5X8_DATST|nr:hypothetical protein [Datura stramonium]
MTRYSKTDWIYGYASAGTQSRMRAKPRYRTITRTRTRWGAGDQPDFTLKTYRGRKQASISSKTKKSKKVPRGYVLRESPISIVSRLTRGTIGNIGDLLRDKPWGSD